MFQLTTSDLMPLIAALDYEELIAYTPTGTHISCVAMITDTPLSTIARFMFHLTQEDHRLAQAFASHPPNAVIATDHVTLYWPSILYPLD